MNSLCPCCSQPISPLTLAVCLESNVATRLGREVKFQPHQAVILDVLRGRAPRITSLPHLAAKVWGMGNAPDDELNTLRVMISQIRRRLAPLYTRIENTHSTGYRLVLDELPAVKEIAA